MVFDVRFTPNPYYIESMRNQTGKNELVRDYVLGFDETQCFLIKLREMRTLIPNYIKEGKSQLVIEVMDATKVSTGLSHFRGLVFPSFKKRGTGLL